MSDYPKELWLVLGQDIIVFGPYTRQDRAVESAIHFDKVCPANAPHLIARVTPEWKKPEEQQ